MTAGNYGNGAGTPENEDPFAYLYRSDGGADGGGNGTAAKQPGVPRTSYNQVRAVGERRGAQQQVPPSAPQQPPGHPPGPNPHYAAPETQPGGRVAARQHAAAGGGHGRGPKRNGPLIAAIAVVAAVVIGVGAAILFSEDDAPQDRADPDSSAEASGGGGQESEGQGQDGGQDQGKDTQEPLPSSDAATFGLGGSAVVADDVPGAKAEGGRYVAGMQEVGSSATWTLEVEQAGPYTLHVGYGVPGKDADATLAVNGEVQPQPLNMKNFAKAEKGAWDKGWTRTYAFINLESGQNTVTISCEKGNKCRFNLDRAWLEAGHQG